MSKVLLRLFGLLGIVLGIGLLVLAGLAYEKAGLEPLPGSVPTAFAPLTGGVLLLGVARLIRLLEVVVDDLKHANDRLGLLNVGLFPAPGLGQRSANPDRVSQATGGSHVSRDAQSIPPRVPA